MPIHYLHLALAIAAEVAATSALAASAQFTRLGPSIIVVAGYGAAFYFLSLTLEILPVGIVYAIWSGLGVVFVALIGFLWSVKSGQFDDLDGAAHRILFDDDIDDKRQDRRR